MRVLASLALGWSACALAAPRSGLWEFTTTTHIPGMPALPPGAPAGLGPGAPRIQRQCLSGQDIAPRASSPSGECARDSVELLGNTVHYTVTCQWPMGAMRGEGSATYAGDSMTATVNLSGQREGNPFAMSMNTTGRYLGPSCDAK